MSAQPPPQPGDRIVVLYRDAETKYGMTAVLAQVIPRSDRFGGRDAASVWFRGAGGRALCRRLDEEGVEWARVSATDVANWELHGGWAPVVAELQAARRLAGTSVYPPDRGNWDV